MGKLKEYRHDSCGCKHEHTHHGCGCGHEHTTGNRIITRIIVSAVLFVAALLVGEYNEYVGSAVFALAYIIVGYDVVWKSVSNILKGHFFDENLLMTIAGMGAFLIGEQAEGVAVILLYQFGEMLQHKAVDKSERSIEALLDVRADIANVERDGELLSVSPEEVGIGEIVVVKNGEKIPLDGVVCDGEGMLDTSAITGESVPRRALSGDGVMGGSVNCGGMIKIKVTREYSESTFSKIIEFMENSRNRKPKAERFMSRFASYYTPVVVILAILTMIIPPLFDGMNFIKWIERALVFLVVSCPCALVISIPLGFFSAMGAASKQGVLVKGGEYIEWLSKLDTIVFDKTGTLTKGVFKVTEVNGDSSLEIAAACEQFSNHPIASAIVNAYGGIPDIDVSDLIEIAGMGVSAVLDGHKTLVGNTRLLEKNNILCPESDAQVHIARDGEYIGSITISDELKEDSKDTIELFKKTGITTVMLTGDKRTIAEKTAMQLGVDIVKSELLPTEKAEEFLKLNGVRAFVGDGINDAPVLSAAHVGVAMGGIGSDSAVEAADAVILNDEPSKVASVCRISKRAMFVIKENIIFSIAIKLIAMILGFAGVPNIMWFAIFADVGTAMIAIANAMRILRFK